LRYGVRLSGFYCRFAFCWRDVLWRAPPKLLRISSLHKEILFVMNTLLIGSLALSLVAVVLALIRESRLRRALQKILAGLLRNWRKHEFEHDSEDD
jgi:hypothetical protein